ncbi:MAG: slipin family protein [Oscillospiraceae bacterium]|nr:slipin family protein [Oscillospiraceae bacterium]
MDTFAIVALVITAFIALWLLLSSIIIINQVERGVVFRFGKVVGVKEPGIRMRFPFGIDVIHKVDLRTRTIDVPQQEVITKDNISILVDAVVYYNVQNPVFALTKVVDFERSTTLLGQTSFRSVLGQHELDEILSKNENLVELLRKLLDELTDEWGIKIIAVEIKSIQIPDTMKRAMAKQAEAERERRAKVTAAEGEFQASQKLLEAAKVIAIEPTALQLRYLQTLTEIAVEQNSTILFPLPIEILKAFGMK